MRLGNCTVDEFAAKAEKKRVFGFGASEMPGDIYIEYGSYHFETLFYKFVDNSREKQGASYNMGGREIPIISPEEMLEEIDSDDIILITSKYYVEIFEQLTNYTVLADVECYIWPAVAPQYQTDKQLQDKISQTAGINRKIPKVIHYIWFGNNPIPSLEQKCIESWKRIMPDYEIVCWNENNYDVSKHPYMKQAYAAGKWGFVSDYARLDIVYQYGGIYLDTDVEVLKKFDNLLGLSAFAGFESKSLVALGLGFGAEKGNQMIRILREDYDNYEFDLGNGRHNLKACPFIQTDALLKYGLQLDNQFQVLEDMAILPAECFSPDYHQFPHITPNTYSIHHFSGSWTSINNQASIQKARQWHALNFSVKGRLSYGEQTGINI